MMKLGLCGRCSQPESLAPKISSDPTKCSRLCTAVSVLRAVEGEQKMEGCLWSKAEPGGWTHREGLTMGRWWFLPSCSALCCELVLPQEGNSSLIQVAAVTPQAELLPGLAASATAKYSVESCLELVALALRAVMKEIEILLHAEVHAPYHGTTNNSVRKLNERI